MSKRLDRRRRRLRLLRRRKYFWAWLATCVGVRVLTKFLEIPFQSPFPAFSNPNRNSLCSSSVHGTPVYINKSIYPYILDYLLNFTFNFPTQKYIELQIFRIKMYSIHINHLHMFRFESIKEAREKKKRPNISTKNCVNKRTKEHIIDLFSVLYGSNLAFSPDLRQAGGGWRRRRRHNHRHRRRLWHRRKPIH